nr:putative integron gene cassette protein [uncultured bacterium]
MKESNLFSGLSKKNFFARIAFFILYAIALAFLWDKTSTAIQTKPEASLGLIVITAVIAVLAIKNSYAIVVLYRKLYSSRGSA